MKKGLMQKILLAGLFAGMPLVLNGCLTAVVAGASGTAGAVIGSDTRTINVMVYDETIEQRGSEILRSNPLLSNKDDFNVSIYSMSGNVLLTGQTTNMDYLKWCIGQIRQQDYVRHIYNYVTNKKPVSASVQASDAYITSKIKSKLLFGKQINSGRFKVVTEDSEVFLMGFVNSDEATRASNLARSTEGVSKVYTIFDYLNESQLTTRPHQDDSLVVRRVDSGSAASSSSQVYSSPGASSSTYITPVDDSANGGAAIVESGDSSSLLAPAQPLELY